MLVRVLIEIDDAEIPEGHRVDTLAAVREEVYGLLEGSTVEVEPSQLLMEYEEPDTFEVTLACEPDNIVED